MFLLEVCFADSDYGETGYLSIKQKVEENEHICLADPIIIYNAHFKQEDYRNIVRYKSYTVSLCWYKMLAHNCPLQ